MHYMEIAGLKISYRNVSDLNLKLSDSIKKINRKRVKAQSFFESFRDQEEKLRKFLGETIPEEATDAASDPSSDAN